MRGLKAGLIDGLPHGARAPEAPALRNFATAVARSTWPPTPEPTEEAHMIYTACLLPHSFSNVSGSASGGGGTHSSFAVTTAFAAAAASAASSSSSAASSNAST